MFSMSGWGMSNDDKLRIIAASDSCADNTFNPVGDENYKVMAEAAWNQHMQPTFTACSVGLFFFCRFFFFLPCAFACLPRCLWLLHCLHEWQTLTYRIIPSIQKTLHAKKVIEEFFSEGLREIVAIGCAKCNASTKNDRQTKTIRTIKFGNALRTDYPK